MEKTTTPKEKDIPLLPKIPATIPNRQSISLSTTVIKTVISARDKVNALIAEREALEEKIKIQKDRIQDVYIGLESISLVTIESAGYIYKNCTEIQLNFEKGVLNFIVNE